MNAWWIALSLIEKILVCIAIPSTLLLVIQTVLLLFGFGDDGDADVDAGTSLDGDGVDSGDLSVNMDLDIDGDGLADIAAGGGFRLFTFKGIVSFLAVMGWTGYTLIRSGVHSVLSVFIGVIAGLAVMALIGLAFYYFAKLQSSGNIDIKNAIGKSGSVYLNVPPHREGVGKVNVVVQERLCEYDAVSDEETVLKFGAEVVVVGVSGLNTLVVKKK